MVWPGHRYIKKKSGKNVLTSLPLHVRGPRSPLVGCGADRLGHVLPGAAASPGDTVRLGLGAPPSCATSPRPSVPGLLRCAPSPSGSGANLSQRCSRLTWEQGRRPQEEAPPKPGVSGPFSRRLLSPNDLIRTFWALLKRPCQRRKRGKKRKGWAISFFPFSLLRDARGAWRRPVAAERRGVRGRFC